LVVWLNHRKIYKAGGFNLSKFWTSNMTIFNDCRKDISDLKTSETAKNSLQAPHSHYPVSRIKHPVSS